MLKLIRLHTPYFLLLTSYSLLYSSCSAFDPPLVVPAYGHIDSIHFSVAIDSVAKQGSASSNVQYAWVYLDDNPIGAFQMPCTFPMIVSNGIHNIKVYPGITPAGGNSPAGIYPFYQFYSITMNLQDGKTYNLNPTSTYYTWSQFPYKENFDEGIVGAQPAGIKNYYGGTGNSGKSDTTMHVINGKLAFQNQSGMVIVDAINSYYIGMTDPALQLPVSATPVNVELNYRCTAPFTIGMFEGDTITQIQPLVIVYPSTKWQKMYVTLNSTLSSFPIQPYRLYFSMLLPTGDVSDTLLLDNIKILD